MEKTDHKIHVGNMVCDRCISAVIQILDREGIKGAIVGLGSILMPEKPDSEKQARLKKELNDAGFTIVNNHAEQITEKIKNAVIRYIYNIGEHETTNLSFYLQQQINLEYNYMSTVFSAFEGTTIEKYSIALKIERAKEMLEPGDKTISQIAFELGYSSSAHLSAQFKKITGFPPSRYKISNPEERKSIADVP
jgi:AraC-like DNA-binding protein